MSQKHAIDPQKLKRREHECNTEENQQSTKGKTNKGIDKKYKINRKTRFK